MFIQQDKENKTHVLLFEGITGNVSIDANGDRNADYSLLDLNPETGKFEVSVEHSQQNHAFIFFFLNHIFYLKR